jgi:hypothetical protein
MSNIPKQVDEAAELAEQLHEKMFAPHEGNEQPPEEEPEELPEAAESVDTSEEETYKSRYETMQGKYNAEVPRLHNELKELKAMVFERLGDVSKRQEQPIEVKVDPNAERLAKFEEEYGKEFLEMQRLLARMEAEELIKQRVTPMQEQVTTVEETQIKAAQQNFVSYLDSKVENGDWQALWAGQDEKFNQFLQTREPTSGLSYQQIVKYHNDNWDADGLAAVFNTYLGPAVEVTPEPPAKPKQPNPAKEAIVAPSRNTHTAPPQQSDKRIWNNATIEEFKRADRANKYSPDESQAMWDDLLQAMVEGRIR